MRNPTIVASALLTAVVLGGSPGLHAATADTSGLEISRHGALLTLTVVATPLADVLRVIGQRTDVRVNFRGDVTTPVTATFRGVPIDEGIKRLARGYSVCLLYGSAADGRAAPLREAWIIATPPATRIATAVDRQRQATWLREIQQLGTRRDTIAIAALARLVAQDDDPVVRAQAAKTLGRVQDPAAGAALATALSGDPDSRVRRMAARALGTLDTEDARRALERASADPDAAVRREISRALGRAAPVPR